MTASVIDLRYNMKKIIQALDRREKITLSHRGKIKGYITPSSPEHNGMSVKNHSFFGIHAAHQSTVDSVMDDLRGGRTRDI